MAVSVSIAQQDIRDHLAEHFTQTALEAGVPASEELLRDDGMIRPYIIYNFADLAPSANHSLAGARFDGYTQPVNIYAIASDVSTARALNAKILDQFIGFQPSYSGQMRKRPGGGAFAIVGQNGASEAYIVAASFVYSVEFVSNTVTSGPISTQFPAAILGLIDNGDGTIDVYS